VAPPASTETITGTSAASAAVASAAVNASAEPTEWNSSASQEIVASGTVISRRHPE